MRLAALLFVLFLANESQAMNVAPPGKRIFKDATGTIAVTLTNDAPPTVKSPDGKHTWPDRPQHPKTVLVSQSAKTVIFLGGHGDSGSSLGRVALYDLTGKPLAAINLQTSIPDLDHLAQTWEPNKGNFPWLAAQSLSKDEQTLQLNVCNAYDVTVDLKTHAMTVAKR